MLARVFPESVGHKTDTPVGLPSFRFHGFIRNVESLFGSADLGNTGMRVDDLTIERGVSHGKPSPDSARGRRLFGLICCEACGELLLGGQRGSSAGNTKVIEKLPSAADLEAIPEKAGSEYYDKMTWAQFAVFWPKTATPRESERGYDHWTKAALDPTSGAVTERDDVSAGHIGGHIYFQTDDAIQNDKGREVRLAQPFCIALHLERPFFSVLASSECLGHITGLAADLDAPVSRCQLSEGRHACALRLSCALCVHREVKTGTNVCNFG
jgi:hypothetical protein